MLKQINIQDLLPGMVIVRITIQNGPVKIKKTGLVTSLDMVQGLIEMGIQQVEVDTDQTVEVEVAAPKIKKSATRRMLESNKVTHVRPQNDLPDQFHRNLYLPSVQDIPSPWQFYGKRYLLAAFIALGGLSFGWTLANYQGVVSIFSSPPDKPIVSESAPVASSLAQNTQQPDNTVGSATQVDTPQEVKSKEVTNTAEQPVIAPEQTKQGTETSDVERAITPPVEPEAQISADVLARFRKAMTEVEDSPVAPVPVENSSNSQGVPRIDQLPPWLMTRLPGMAFSAHMYASVESDRWVRVNGTRMVEGDKIDGVIEIVRIEPQHVILSFSGQTFSMAALTDW